METPFHKAVGKHMGPLRLSFNLHLLGIPVHYNSHNNHTPHLHLLGKVKTSRQLSGQIIQELHQ
jgi:hypothetical protein